MWLYYTYGFLYKSQKYVRAYVSALHTGNTLITHTTRKRTSETDTTHLIINYVYNFGDAGHLAFLQGPTPQSDNPERLIFS